MASAAEEEIAMGEQALGELNYESAFKHFDKAIKAEAGNSLAYFGKAEAALGIPKVDAEEILTLYRKAIELDADNAQYFDAMASFCMDLGRFNEAEENYNRAAAIDPENAPFYWSEFAIHYARKAPVVMEQFLDDRTRDLIRSKSVTYMLKALGIEREDAKRVL